jgi:hypothetical protein
MRAMTFGELMEAKLLPEVLQEYLTYDQLFRMSEPKRFQRSLTVKMPPLDMEQYQTGNHWIFGYYFNAKGNPSTTGLRHRGYVRFRKPKKSHAGKNTPLSQLPVEVDCMCPDYRYRWAWANHQRSAGPIGANSLNQCLNRAPRKTNPKGMPGLCKHILATRDYIYGLLSGFPPWMGTTDRLDKLTKRATRRWLNFDAEMEKARERDAKIAAAKARRNIGLPPERQNRPIAVAALDEPPDLPGEEGPQAPQPPEAPHPPRPARPGRAARPPAAPTAPIAPGQPKGLSPEQFLAKRFMKVESVDSITNMKTWNLQEAKVINDARKLVEELEDDIEGIGGGPEPDDMPPASGETMPMEPPVSDSAVGASTEDNVALGLLREIRDLLADLVSEEGAEEGEVPEMPEEPGMEPGAEGGEDEPGDEEDFRPGKRPMPVPTGAE